MGKAALPHRRLMPFQPHSTVPTMWSRRSSPAMGRVRLTKKLAGVATSKEVAKICTPTDSPRSIPANTAMPTQARKATKLKSIWIRSGPEV